MTETTETPWQPGDPLYGTVYDGDRFAGGRDCYHRPLFSLVDSFTDDNGTIDDTGWNDAASWPDPRPGHALKQPDEPAMLRRRERRTAYRAQVARTRAVEGRRLP